MKMTGGESKSDDPESDMEQYELTEDEEEKEEEEIQETRQKEEVLALHSAPGTMRKRKHSSSQNDDEEIVRRRRQRHSLVFQQRRRPLANSERKLAGVGSGGVSTAPTHSKQYISDMYSTIIKMSSENKINVKNSWSLHLIDHMEDILDSSKRNAADGNDEDTYNFQKASCTLDASIKIYSYRVDDTWNSSYKILENLSRTEQKHGVDDGGSDVEGSARTARKTRKTHARTIEKNLNIINLKAYDTECEADPLFHKMSQSFDEGGAKGMLLANLSVYDGCKILLNSSDVSMVTRKQVCKDIGKCTNEAEDQEDKQKLANSGKSETSDTVVKSNTFHEIGATIANKKSGDGHKDKENGNGKDKDNDNGKAGDESKSEAVKDSLADKNEEFENDIVIEEERCKEKENAAEYTETEEPEKEDCIDDVATEEEVSKEKVVFAVDATGISIENKDSGSSDVVEARKNGKSVGEHLAAQERISLSLFNGLSCINQDVQNLRVCPPLYRIYDQLDKLYGDESRHKLGIRNDFLLTTPVKGRRQTLEKKDVVARNLTGIMEGASEDELDGEDTAFDTSVDFGVNNVDYDADEDSGDTVGEAEDMVEADTAAEMDMDMEKDVIDLAGSDDEDHLSDDLTQSGAESGSGTLDKESSLGLTAVDFFRAKVNKNLPDNYENNLFSEMIESALVRSAAMEDEQIGGEDQDSKNDYSYFDVKMLRNWAGPGHWKFPAVRKVQMKQRLKEETYKDGFDGAVDEDGVAIKAEPTGLCAEHAQKGSNAGVDKKVAMMVDFFGEVPDLSRLKAAKSATSLEVSKGNLKKQSENASDLVLPVDTHIELGLFFRHFLKERPRFFRKRGSSGVVNSAHRKGASASDIKYGDDSDNMADHDDREQTFSYNEDSAGFEGGYDDEYEEMGVSRADGTPELYSVKGLAQADHVVERVGVHYERFAKRVDVKKLKSSIWEHLEKKVVTCKGETDCADASAETTGAEGVSVLASGKRSREPEANDNNDSDSTTTTFANVVVSVANKVPSNVTVSFYFICVLHLANEKGLELIGQEDLRNFQIHKEDASLTHL